MPGQRHRRYTVQEVLKKLKCLPADESDGEKDSDGLDSGSGADFDDTYSDDSVDDNHSSDSSCNFSNESSVEADDSSEEEYRPTPKRRCAVPSSTPSSGAISRQGPHHLMIHMIMKARNVKKQWVMILLPCKPVALENMLVKTDLSGAGLPLGQEEQMLLTSFIKHLDCHYQLEGLKLALMLFCCSLTQRLYEGQSNTLLRKLSVFMTRKVLPLTPQCWQSG